MKQPRLDVTKEEVLQLMQPGRQYSAWTVAEALGGTTVQLRELLESMENKGQVVGTFSGHRRIWAVNVPTVPPRAPPATRPLQLHVPARTLERLEEFRKIKSNFDWGMK